MAPGALARAFMPHDPPAAARTGAVLTILAASITVVFVVVVPQGSVAARWAALCVPAGLAVLSLYFRRATHEWPALVWLVAPVLGIVAIALLDLATNDASATGQVFLCYPVVYAAALLPPVGAAVVAGVATVADAVVVLLLLPFREALSDFAYVTTVLLTVTVLLVRAAATNDRLVAALRHQASMDPLTSLVTRRILDDAARSALEADAHEDGTALVLVDIDRFKTINDTHGHPVGDAVLIHVSEVLVAACRSDSVIGRIGGDELAVLLPGCTSDSAERRAQQLLEAIRAAPLELADGTLIAISASLGVAHAPSDAHDLESLYGAADRALYLAKGEGRGRVAVTPRRSARRTP
jgi:diguanylate cyclase (GGDEF)-like protein